MFHYYSSLKCHYKAWERIKAPSIVQRWVNEGVPLPFTDIPQGFHECNANFSIEHKRFIRAEIKVLVKSGAIRKSQFKPYCVSPIKRIPKKNKQLRLICDLRLLNEHISPPSFQNDGINTVSNLIDSKDELVTLDLEKGFLHVTVNPEYWQYLGFEFENCYYTWCSLPFGLNCSPYYFTKILRPVISFLRQQFIKTHILAERKHIVDIW